MLQSIQVHSLRNIETLVLNNLKKNNVITGDNGAGKTSLLEAIHILLTGKSFRTNQISQVIQDHNHELVVSGNLKQNIKLGVARNRKAEFRIRINETSENKLSVLASHMPVRQIAPDSFLMLTTGSKLRRQFLDFSVFHVKHDFAKHWQMYQRQLKQRNALLKTSSSYSELLPWDEQMITTIMAINDSRAKVFAELNSYLQSNQLTFLPQYNVQYTLKTGVSSDDLKSLYEANYSIDKRYGHTTVGPHKADIAVTIEDTDAHTMISRGELKMLIISMVLAQTDWLNDKNKDCCLLIDDLTSELDIDRQRQLLEKVLDKPGLQCFISSINNPEYLTKTKIDNLAMFHVEHGRLVLN